MVRTLCPAVSDRPAIFIAKRYFLFIKPERAGPSLAGGARRAFLCYVSRGPWAAVVCGTGGEGDEREASSRVMSSCEEFLLQS